MTATTLEQANDELKPHGIFIDAEYDPTANCGNYKYLIYQVLRGGGQRLLVNCSRTRVTSVRAALDRSFAYLNGDDR